MSANAEVITRTYVEFMQPGILFPNSYTEEVQDRGIDNIKPGPNVYAFRFYDYDTAEVNGETFSGKRHNNSGFYFVGGALYEIDDLPNTPEFDILRSNMQNNDYSRVIRCRTGNWLPFGADDTILNPDS
jgi:hypothetical protein